MTQNLKKLLVLENELLRYEQYINIHETFKMLGLGVFCLQTKEDCPKLFKFKSLFCLRPGCSLGTLTDGPVIRRCYCASWSRSRLRPVRLCARARGPPTFPWGPWGVAHQLLSAKCTQIWIFQYNLMFRLEPQRSRASICEHSSPGVKSQTG